MKQNTNSLNSLLKFPITFIPKPLAYKYQTTHAFSLLLKPHFRDTQGIEIFGQSILDVESHEDGQILTKLLGIGRNADHGHLLSVDCIKVQSYEFRKGAVVMTDLKDSDPEFVQIEHIFIFEMKVLLPVQTLETQYFYRHYHAYATLPTNFQTLVPFNLVKLQRPLHLTRSSNTNDKFFMSQHVGKSSKSCLEYGTIIMDEP